MSDSDAEELVTKIQEYSIAFDHLTAERHREGAEEYGQLTFLGNDVVRMMMEELADTANYCRYQFVKLMFLQEQLEKNPVIGNALSGGKEGDEIQINLGAQSFKGVGETGWNR